MSYTINGPVTLGDTGQSTTIKGNLTLPDLLTAQGQMIYSGAGPSFAPTALNATNGGVMVSSTTAPSWLAPGTNGQLLTMVGGVPAWANLSDSSSFGFLARKTGTQGGITNTATVITTWSSTAGAGSPEYDTTGGAWSSAAGTFTVPVGGTGYYQISANVGYQETSNIGERALEVVLNPAGIPTVIFRTIEQSSATTTYNQLLSLSTNARLIAGDVVAIQIYTYSGSGTLTVQASPNTSFGIVRLSL